VAEDGGPVKEEAAPSGVRPGEVSALLAELAHAPPAGLGEGWDRWLRPGAVVGRFELVREIGRGGFGVVWEARDRELGRTVAFKAVRAGDRAGLREERLLREAEAAARLSHPNIVTLFDVGRCEHGPYLVLEMLRGQTLADRLEQGPLPLREALRIGVEVARGVAHAHGQGVVHRDLKPGNVLLCEDGQVKVLDFGLAHALGQRRTGGGTPAYMAPEQWKGAPEDERTDVFALGVMLYRMLVNELPFPDDDGGKAIASSRPAAALDVPDSPAVGALVARMLEKDPVRRPRDGADVLAALTAFQDEIARTPSSSSAPARARRRPVLRAAALLGAVALLAMLAAGIALRWRWQAARGPQERVTVAVADFANQTGEPELDGLSGMLITSLEQSRRLSVLTRARMVDVLRQLGKANVEAVDEALGRELALGAGVRALVLATIRRFDQLYAIEVKVLDPATSEYLFTLKEEGRGKSSVPGMIDRISERARERLRETPAEVQASRVRVADATTASFAAYQHYFRGDQLKEAIRYEQAIAEYRRAIAIDPDFALAHYRIAYLGQFTAMDEAGRRAEIEAALRGVDRVPERERLHILAWKAHVDGRDDEAHALYARAVELYPQDKEALFMAGDLHLHRGRPAEALPYFERAAALDPAWEPALMHVADALAQLGRAEDLMRHASTWTRRAPSASSYRALALAHLSGGRAGDAVDAARRALDLDGTGYSRNHLAEALIQAGRYEEAENLLRPFAAPGRSALDRAHAIPPLALALAYQGRRREALAIAGAYPAGAADSQAGRLLQIEIRGDEPHPEALARESRALIRELPPEKRRGMSVWLAALGDREGAIELAGPAAPEQERVLVEAALAFRAGRAAAALEPLREAARRASAGESGVALWLLSQAALEGGRPEEAVAAVERFRTAPSGAWRSWAWPRALHAKALALERMGDREGARRTVDGLLETWRRADPDLPGLSEARALRDRLARPALGQNRPSSR
jgi:tetratricopeptide (TPR) repeat protein